MPGMLSSLPTKQDFTILRGRTFREFVRWMTEPPVFVRIQTIDQSGPCLITTQTPHGIPAGWPKVAIVDAVGMTELNAENNPPKDKDYRRTLPGDTTSFKLYGISSALFGEHKAGSGYVQYYTPQSLAGLTARMSIKDGFGGELLLSSLDGDIVVTLDDSSKTITIDITAAVTEALGDWTCGIYDLELEDGTGDVVAVLTGAVTVVDEVTTPITP